MRRPSYLVFPLLVATVFCVHVSTTLAAEPAEQAKGGKTGPQRLLLIGSAPDGHEPTTHEYLPAMRVIEACLKDVKGLKIKTVKADQLWKEGPGLLAGADGALMFLTEGAKWLQSDQRRLQAMSQLAQRKGGLVVLHWGMGARDDKYVAGYLKLLGGCHGGKTRRYKVVETELSVADTSHPVTRGVQPVRVREEFYYRLKFVKPSGSVRPIMSAQIEGQPHTVAWAWERPDGGRSFGFSGLHFHDNWKHETYRRLVSQAILWSMKMPIPKRGVDVRVDAQVIELKKEAK